MSENPQEPQTPQQPGPAPQQPGPAPQQPQDAPAYGTPQPQPQSPYQGPPAAGPAYSTGYGPGAPYQPQPLTPSDERMWTVFAQVGAIIFSFVPPLVIWLVFKDRSRFVEQEAKESLNFTITVIIANVALAIIAAVTFGLGTILYIVLIAAVVFQILAAVENGKGAPYRYPVNIRFIK
ncbi:DUF4870 domain-containing protein [Promicromonospora sp. NPDC019610]|uniref:DUF4870 domain-containing protein n=1 Tax=Promicromonospora sp. NPDC019610 TaxID=3364405 RepID=UPI0037B2B64A